MHRYGVRVVFWTAVTVVLLLGLWRPVLRLFYPVPYAAWVREAARSFDVDPHLVVAIMRTESHFRPDAVSPRGARGLMQLMPETALWAAEQVRMRDYTPERITDPQVNIALGTWYLRFLLDTFQQRALLAVAAYNAGPGAVQAWVEQGIWEGTLATADSIPFAETRQYVYRVLDAYRLYRIIYGSDHPGYIDLL